MSKNKGPEPTPAEDYFAQLSWQRRYRRWRRIPSRGDPKEPKWCYKIEYSKEGLPDDAGIFHKAIIGFLQVANWVAGIAVFVLLLIGLTSLLNGTSVHQDGTGLAVIVMGGFVLVTIIAAIEDSKDTEDNK